jgi:TolA-binding protein
MDELDSPFRGVRLRLKDVRRIAQACALGKSGYRDLAAALLKHYSDREDAFSCESLILGASLIAPDDPVGAVATLEPGRDRCDDIFGVYGLLYERASHVCSQGPYDACSEAAQNFRQRFPLAERGQLGIASRSALLLFRDGEGDSAAAMVDSLVATGKTHPLLAETVYRKGVHHMVEGEHARAVRAFRLIEQDYRQHDLYHDACFKLGTAYYMMGRYDSSAVYFRIASQSEKASLVENAFFNLGLALEKHGDLASGARAFWSLAMRFPMSERFERSLMRCAYAHERIGRLKEGARVYKGLLHYAQDPETAAEAMYWMGETFSEMGKHLNSAVEFLRVGHMFPEETAWAGTARYRAGVECEKIGLIGHAATIYEQNVARFGTETDWGNASEERLTLLREGTIEPRNPTTQPNEDE